MKDTGVAIGIADSAWSSKIELRRRNVFGQQLTVNPTCLEGVCLSIGFQKLLTVIDYLRGDQSRQALRGKTLDIHSRYWQQLTSEQRKRRRRYGAVWNPLPCEHALKEMLAKVANSCGLAAIHLAAYHIPVSSENAIEEMRNRGKAKSD